MDPSSLLFAVAKRIIANASKSMGVKKGVQLVDTKSGAVAVVRNLKSVYKMSQIDPQKREIVVTDR